MLKHLTPSKTWVVHYEPLRVEERTARLSTFDGNFAPRLQLLQDTLRPCASLAPGAPSEVRSATSAVRSAAALDARRARLCSLERLARSSARAAVSDRPGMSAISASTAPAPRIHL